MIDGFAFVDWLEWLMVMNGCLFRIVLTSDRVSVGHIRNCKVPSVVRNWIFVHSGVRLMLADSRIHVISEVAV